MTSAATFSALEGAVADACGCPVANALRIQRGGNSQLYRVTLRDGRVVAAKVYPAPGADPRNRLETEFTALSFLRSQAVRCVPDALARVDVNGLGIYEWIDGTPAPPSAQAVEQMARFCEQLLTIPPEPARTAIRLASEACLSGEILQEQLDMRLQRLLQLENEAELHDFLLADVQPRLAGLDLTFPTLPPEQQCLSPSDFGTHNMLIRNGLPVFLDFEYFGWDDPVKLASDVVWHPGMNLSAQLGESFVRAVQSVYAPRDSQFQRRLYLCLPAYGLRWIMIVLNEFLPERWVLRMHAGAQDQAEAKARQLRKARAILARVGSLSA